MDRLIILQCINIIKTYYKNGDSDYGLHNRPTAQTIGKIVKKSEETGVVTNIERSVHYRFARSAENITIVCERVDEGPNVFCIQIYTYIHIKSSSCNKLKLM